MPAIARNRRSGRSGYGHFSHGTRGNRRLLAGGGRHLRKLMNSADVKSCLFINAVASPVVILQVAVFQRFTHDTHTASPAGVRPAAAGAGCAASRTIIRLRLVERRPVPEGSEPHRRAIQPD